MHDIWHFVHLLSKTLAWWQDWITSKGIPINSMKMLLTFNGVITGSLTRLYLWCRQGWRDNLSICHRLQSCTLLRGMKALHSALSGYPSAAPERRCYISSTLGGCLHSLQKARNSLYFHNAFLKKSKGKMPLVPRRNSYLALEWSTCIKSQVYQLWLKWGKKIQTLLPLIGSCLSEWIVIIFPGGC